MEKTITKNIHTLPRQYVLSLMDKACANGNVNEVSVLLKNKVEPSRSALYFAARAGSIEICKLLLAAGCNINEVDPESGRAGLFGAIHSHNPAVFDFFMQSGASPDIKDLAGSNPLMFAAAAGNETAFLSLIKAHGFNLDTQDVLGNTALMYCALVNKTNCLNAILDLHVRSDLTNKLGLTALGSAIEFYSYEAAFTLARRNPSLSPFMNAETNFDKEYITTISDLIQAEIAENPSKKTAALNSLSSLCSRYASEIGTLKNKVAGMRFAFIFVNAFENAAAETGVGPYWTRRAFVERTPGGFWDELLTPRVVVGGGADYMDETIKAWTISKIKLQRRLAVCSLVLKNGSASGSAAERLAALKAAYPIASTGNVRN